MLRAYLSDIPCPLLVTDLHGRVLVINDELCNALGGTVSDWVGQSLDKGLSRASSILCQTHVWPMLLRHGRVREIFMELQPAAGDRVPVMINALLTERDGNQHVVWLFFVARERSQYESALLESKKRAEALAVELAQAKSLLAASNVQLEARVEQTEEDNRALAHLSTTDMLTGLGNRRALEQFTVDLAAQRNPHQTMPLSVLLIDVDHFKRVNDTHGHSQGDEVLRQLGRSLRDCARQRDSVVRYGGEEFAMLLPHTDTQQAMQMAQRLHDRIRTLRPAGLDITVSIGIASGSLTTAEDVSRLISQADKALYEAKNEGRNRTRVSGVA